MKRKIMFRKNYGLCKDVLRHDEHIYDEGILELMLDNL